MDKFISILVALSRALREEIEVEVEIEDGNEVDHLMKNRADQQ